MKGFGVIPHNIKATALHRTIWTESADNHMTAWFYCRCDIPDISDPVFGRRQEVKNGAIVPDIVGVGRKTRLYNISPPPANGFRSFSQAPLSDFKSGLRNIPDCNIPVSPLQQVVNQCRCAAACIDDRCALVPTRGTFDQSERSLQMRTEPAHLIRCFGPVDFLPILLNIH